MSGLGDTFDTTCVVHISVVEVRSVEYHISERRGCYVEGSREAASLECYHLLDTCYRVIRYIPVDPQAAVDRHCAIGRYEYRDGSSADIDKFYIERDSAGSQAVTAGVNRRYLDTVGAIELQHIRCEVMIGDVAVSPLRAIRRVDSNVVGYGTFYLCPVDGHTVVRIDHRRDVLRTIVVSHGVAVGTTDSTIRVLEASRLADVEGGVFVALVPLETDVCTRVGGREGVSEPMIAFACSLHLGPVAGNVTVEVQRYTVSCLQSAVRMNEQANDDIMRLSLLEHEGSLSSIASPLAYHLYAVGITSCYREYRCGPCRLLANGFGDIHASRIVEIYVIVLNICHLRCIPCDGEGSIAVVHCLEVERTIRRRLCLKGIAINACVSV